MWGCHGDLISSYPETHLPLSLNTLHQHYHLLLLLLLRLLLPPSCKQDGGRKAWEKHFGGSDNDAGGVEGQRRKRRRCDVEEQLVSRLANIICFGVAAFCCCWGAYFASSVSLVCLHVTRLSITEICRWWRLTWAHSKRKTIARRRKGNARLFQIKSTFLGTSTRIWKTRSMK